MKKIVTTILSISALLVSVTSAFAQEQQLPPNEQEQVIPDEYHDNGSGIVYSKIAQGPNEYGEYTIYLKSYVKGTVQHSEKKIPTDIVLVLDVSGSMDDKMATPTEKTSWSYNDIYNSTEQYYYRVQRGGDTYYYPVVAYYASSGPSRYRLYYNNNNGYTEIGRASGADNVIYNNVLYTGAGTSRMEALQDAVETFIGQIKDDADEKGVDNRIAIVKFASNEYNNDHTPSQSNPTTAVTGINPVTDSNNWRYYDLGDDVYYNYSQIVANFTDVRDGGDATLTGYVNNFVAAGATSADYGMKRAKWLLQVWAAAKPTRVSNKIVVMFTDGEPNHRRGFDDSVADGAISQANTIKGMTAYTDPETGKSANVKVYTIGTFTQLPDKVKKYMNYVSSNYPGASSMTDGGDGSDTGGFFFNVTNPAQLANVFKVIAMDSASPVVEMDNTTSVVDIVSQSFILPTGSDHNTVQVYTTPPNGVDSEGNLMFSIDKTKWSRITSQVVLTSNPATGSVTVSGFDFGENACASVVDGDDRIYLGRELILEIPIMMDKDAVGGHGVQTNVSGSGITYTNKTGTHKFTFEDSPNISLPISLHIEKRGLKYGESARFRILRKWSSPATPPEGIVADTWYDYTTVFVTGGKETKDRDGIVDENPTVRIVGLNPNYVYKIKEEDWGWSYDVSSVSGFWYDSTTGNTTDVSMENGTKADLSDNTVLSSSVNLNPIVFVNTPAGGDLDIEVRHAESIVTNDFSKGSGTGTTIGSKD